MRPELEQVLNEIIDYYNKGLKKGIRRIPPRRILPTGRIPAPLSLKKRGRQAGGA